MSSSVIQMSGEEVIRAKPIEERKRIKNVSKLNQIPDEILNNELLNHKIRSTLPENYNFELHKTIWRLKSCNARRVCLQFPEGLFVFAITIADIIEEFAQIDVFIMGDVTYGGCCVDDFTANALKCDFIIHYAHSCLVSVNQMLNGIKVLYVFVDIKIDLWHLIHTIVLNFNKDIHNISIASTIQFVSSIHSAAKELREKHGFQVFIPQSKPLSPGEVLGCTAAKLPKHINTIVFVADGRFHLEAIMIANPTINAFKYNPYNKEITQEFYDFNKMSSFRQKAIDETSKVCSKSGTFGLILGTLGRQGNPHVLQHLINNINKFTNCQTINVLLPEIKPEFLSLFKEVDSWVQIACPRLSIDWGNNFINKPLLTPYELNVAIKSIEHKDKYFKDNNNYPMDFYAISSYGKWTPNHKCHSDCVCDKQ